MDESNQYSFKAFETKNSARPVDVFFQKWFYSHPPRNNFKKFIVLNSCFNLYFIYVSFSTRFETSVLVVDVYATVTLNPAISLTLWTLTSCSAAVSTTLAELSVKDAVPVSYRKPGGNPKTLSLSPANVIIQLNNIRSTISWFRLFFSACNCFGHSDECQYNPEIDHLGKSLDINGFYEGGGVCQNCRHNTQGINCNECKPTFYRPYDKQLNDTDVCQRERKIVNYFFFSILNKSINCVQFSACQCDVFYSTGNCAEGSGQCECRPEYLSPNCDQCSFGYYGYPECRPCDCHLNGTRDNVCEVGGGQCPCKYNYAGNNCDRCAPGFFNFPECKRKFNHYLPNRLKQLWLKIHWLIYFCSLWMWVSWIFIRAVWYRVWSMSVRPQLWWEVLWTLRARILQLSYLLL